jgi:hypothetical protein
MRGRRAIAGAAALAALAAATGCGGSSKPDPLRTYVDRVNAIARRAAPQFAHANQAYKQFAAGRLRGRRAAFDLREAELAIADAQHGVAAIPAPPAARRLRARLLRMYQLNVLMAADTRQMAVYQDQSRELLSRLAPLRARLRHELAAASGPDGQVSALRRYAGAISRIAGELRRLHPPPVLDASAQTQQMLLDRSGPLARRLADAIARRDPVAVRDLTRSFRRTGLSTPERQGLQRASIAAYRQRLVAIDRAAADAQAELLRAARASRR